MDVASLPYDAGAFVLLVLLEYRLCPNDSFVECFDCSVVVLDLGYYLVDDYYAEVGWFLLLEVLLEHEESSYLGLSSLVDGSLLAVVVPDMSDEDVRFGSFCYYLFPYSF